MRVSHIIVVMFTTIKYALTFVNIIVKYIFQVSKSINVITLVTKQRITTVFIVTKQ